MIVGILKEIKAEEKLEEKAEELAQAAGAQQVVER